MVTLIIEAIHYIASCILFYAEAAVGYFIDILYDLFEVFVGAQPIYVSGEETYILDLFFNNSLISTIYWGMAVIGIALTFGFAIISVVKKLFDSTGEKVRMTYGQIVLGAGKSILLIILLSTIIGATVTASGVLMDQITYLFDNAIEIDQPSEIVFTDEQYATMFRIIDNISNHCLNPSYDNRFNINSCYNEVRQDVYELSKQGVFEYTYEGCEDSWQYALRQLYLASDPTEDIAIDLTNQSVDDAITNIMDQVKYNSSFKPLSRYNRGSSYTNITANFGKMMMLVGSFGAAKNSSYDGNDASLTDAVRSQFLSGAKNIYSKSDVEQYFSIYIGKWRHIMVILCEVILVIEFVKIIFAAISRVFNIIFLYITAPPIIATSPLDDGERLKQWVNSFVVQTFSIFGTYIAIRLLVIFVPVIMNSSVHLFSNGYANAMAKVVFVLGTILATQEAGSLIGGILSGNGAGSSLAASNSAINTGLGLSGKAGGYALDAGLSIGGAALSGVATVGSFAVGAVGGAIAGAIGNSFSDNGASSSERTPDGSSPTDKTETTDKNNSPEKPDPNKESKPVDTSNAPKDLGETNGDPDAIESSKKNNTFEAGSINPHVGSGEEVKGGFKLGDPRPDGKTPPKPSSKSSKTSSDNSKNNGPASNNSPDPSTESNPLDSSKAPTDHGETNGDQAALEKGKQNNTFEAGSINSHYGEKTRGGFTLGSAQKPTGKGGKSSTSSKAQGNTSANKGSTQSNTSANKGSQVQSNVSASQGSQAPGNNSAANGSKVPPQPSSNASNNQSNVDNKNANPQDNNADNKNQEVSGNEDYGNVKRFDSLEDFFNSLGGSDNPSGGGGGSFRSVQGVDEEEEKKKEQEEKNPEQPAPEQPAQQQGSNTTSSN